MRGSARRDFLDRRGASLAMLCMALVGPAPWAHAQSGGPGLDRLLRLPDTIEYSTDQKGGATRLEWRQRFEEAHAALANAEKELAATQTKLSAAAGAKSEWQLAPPGVPAQASEDSSSSYQLREQVRRQRAEVDRSKARLRELDVEANLAGVPEEWRSASTNARSSDGASNGSGTREEPTR
jgi:hypothetical protein